MEVITENRIEADVNYKAAYEQLQSLDDPFSTVIVETLFSMPPSTTGSVLAAT